MSETNIPNEYKKQITKSTFPTEIITLPSGGGDYYPIGNSLRSGKVELRLPTAKDEDILTSRSLIQKGTVLDVFMKNLLVDPTIDLDSMLIGDKNALLFATRMLLYGNEYPVSISCPKCNHPNDVTLDISEFETKEIDILPESDGTFTFELPKSKNVIKFKILTQRDENELEETRKKMKKHMKSGYEGELTSRYKKMIISIDGEKDPITIREFVDNMLTMDSKAFRSYLTKITPDVDSAFEFECENCRHSERMGMPISAQFFWPDTD